MGWGYVVVESHDFNRNMMGRADMNPILDTVSYHVVFAGGIVTELT